jgi:hypothetical protein
MAMWMALLFLRSCHKKNVAGSFFSRETVCLLKAWFFYRPFYRNSGSPAATS